MEEIDYMEELDPSEVAGDLMDKLINYCMDHDEYECMPKPDEEDVLDEVLSKVIYKIDPEVEEAIENSETFRDELEKELKEMLNDYWAAHISIGLNDVLDEAYNEIANDENLINFRKVRLLEKYEKVLKEFVDAIDHALNEKKPLSEKELYYWFMDIGDTALGTEAYDWFDLQVDYWLRFYDMLNDNYKLVMLWKLKYNINSLLSKIKQKLSELETLKNES